MDIFILQNIWFILLAVLLSVFLILGGFDLGACILGVKSKEHSDLAIGSITPFWDANQVWLITLGGALFAAFPKAYSLALSNLYTPIMLLIAAIIVRVAAIEFYFMKESLTWRKVWRYTACISASLIVILLGFALSIIFQGKLTSPLSLETVYQGSCAAFALLFFCISQGNLFLSLKSESWQKNFSEKTKLNDEGKKFTYSSIISILSLCIYFFYIFEAEDLFSLMIIAMPLFVGAASYFYVYKKKFFAAIIFNSIFILSVIVIHAALAYPYIIPAEISIENSSSAKTLSIMLGVAGIGVPTILCYTAYSYKVFFKKLK